MALSARRRGWTGFRWGLRLAGRYYRYSGRRTQTPGESRWFPAGSITHLQGWVAAPLSVAPVSTSLRFHYLRNVEVLDLSKADAVGLLQDVCGRLLAGGAAGSLQPALYQVHRVAD